MRQRRFISTREDSPKELQLLDTSKGYNSYLANDVVPKDQLRMAQNSRIPTLGRQRTRRGRDFYSVPAGQTLGAQQVSTAGATDQSISTTGWQAFKFIAASNGRFTRADLNLRNANLATGPIIVELRSDVSGSPKDVLGQSSIPSSSLTSTYGYAIARFIDAPQVISGTSYWLVVYIQSDGTGAYQWSGTNNAATAKISNTFGQSWVTTSYDLNAKTYISTDGPVLGYQRAYKSDGTRRSLLAHATTLYSINDANGVLTALKTGLGTSSDYRFEVINDTVFYVNGIDAPRKWDFTTEAAVAGSPPIANLIIAHKNRLFYRVANDPTKIVFTEAGDFENILSVNFLYIPSPKSPDPIINWGVLNDNLYILTPRVKWALYGADLQSFELRRAPGSKGTTAPDSVQVTRTAIYFASDDGFYAFNGNEDRLLSQAITAEYASAANRSSFGSAVWQNRYYLFYTPSGEPRNSRCWVYNINYDSMESNDTCANVTKTGVWTGQLDNGQFIQASNLVGAVYYAELEVNNYSDMGRAIDWEIRTRYEHYDHPAAEKEIDEWHPRFTAAESNYPVICEYDQDFRDAPTPQLANLQGNGYRLGSPTPTLGNFMLGATVLVAPTLFVAGAASYIQRRYRRSGVSQPVEFLGDTQYFSIRIN